MFHLLSSLCEESGDDGAASGGSADEMQSLKAEIDRLKKHNNKLLDEKKTIQASLKSFEGIDPEKVKSMMSKLESSEEARMLAEGRLDDVVSRRTEKIVLDAEKRASEAEEALKTLSENFNSLSAKHSKSVIETEVRRAAEKSGVLPAAIDDVIFRLNGVFSLGDDGNIESRDKDGNLITVNKKPLDPELAIEKLKESAPHLWPGSSGAGANGSGSQGYNGSNPFKKGPDYNLTEQAKLMKSDRALAERLMSVAKQG